MFLIIGGGRFIKEFIKASKIEALQPYIKQFEHVEWQGFAFWDLIMPLFLFVVGVVMPLAFQKRLARGDSKAKLYRHIIIRVVILFILGMAAQGNLLDYDLSTLEIYCNTLQAIALGYLIASVLMLQLRVLGQVGATAALLMLFCVLMKFVPFPGRGPDVLAADANLAMYIDKLILNGFMNPSEGYAYTWILSSITFACTVMLGVFAGHILRAKFHKLLKVLFLLGIGAATLLLGMGWDIWFPIIKHLWTSSFVLYAAGISYILLAFFYLVIDVIKFRIWAFIFVVIGMNPIFAYMTNSLFDFRRVGNIFVGGLGKWLGPWNDFTQALAGFVVCWLILLYMYRKKTFIKI